MNAKKAAPYLLILGMMFLVIGLATDNKGFAVVSFLLVILALLTGGRWMRRK
jgi:hypothetical protein